MNISKISVLAGIVFGAISTNAFSETGTLTMSGEVTEQSCFIPLPEMTRVLTIEDIDASVLDPASPNTAVASQDFSFNVADCPAGTNNVGVTFNFEADANNPNYMKNNGVAEGVLLGITQENDTPITDGETILSADLDPNTGAGTINAKIQAYRIGSAPSVGGNISSTASVTLTAN